MGLGKLYMRTNTMTIFTTEYWVKGWWIIMGLTGLFKENEYKKQIEELQQQLSSANQILETFGNENIKTYQDLQDRIKKSEQILSTDESKIAQQESRIKNLSADIMEKEKQVVVLDDEILVRSFGLYKPRFLFATSSDYKDRLLN